MKKETSVKPVNICLALFFCTALLAFFAALFFIPDKDFSETEKRVLKTFPKTSFSSVIDGTFEAELEDYLQDQMPLRNFFVGVASYSELLFGQNGTGGVYKASDDYLINVPAEYNKRNLVNNLKKINEFSKDLDVEKYVLIVPETGYIMNDKLPKKHSEYRDDEAFSTIRDSLSDFNFVDVRKVFTENKDNGIYYKTDHHWTMNGVFLAVNEFLKAAEKPLIEKSGFSITTHNGFYGTTHSTSALWLTPPDTMELWRYKNADISVTIKDTGNPTVTTANDVYFDEYLYEYDMYPVYLGGNHGFTHITNKNADDGVLLILKDSFGNSLASQLVSSYREILMIDLRHYRTEAVSDLIAEYSVDTLLVNYGLDNIINDTNLVWLR